MPKTKSADLQRKMASNKKIQENKPALKFKILQMNRGDHFNFQSFYHSPSPNIYASDDVV